MTRSERAGVLVHFVATMCTNIQRASQLRNRLQHAPSATRQLVEMWAMMEGRQGSTTRGTLTHIRLITQHMKQTPWVCAI